MQLKAGQKYNIQIDYFQEGGGASANLLWQNTAEADNSKNMFVERLNEYDMIIACLDLTLIRSRKIVIELLNYRKRVER